MILVSPLSYLRVGRLMTLAFVIVLAGCTQSPISSGPPTEAPSQEAAASLSQAELAYSRQLRKQWGLRSDDAWIRTVADDPASAIGLREFGVAMTPTEVAGIFGRARDAEAVKAVVRAYGARVPEDWAGMFVDQQHGGVLVAQFTDNLDQHRMALAALLHPDAALEVRAVRWSVAELEAQAREIESDRDWFQSIDAELYATDVDLIENKVRVRIKSDNVAASDLVLAHFPKASVFVEQDKPSWAGPLGSLKVLVLDASGRPMPNLLCRPIAVAADAGLGDSGAFSDAGGICSFDQIPSTTFRIDIQNQVEGRWISVGEGIVSVPPDGAASLTIVSSGQ
jgi:hypothetical protein